jgi:phosphoglycolate phosphatase
MAWHAVLFADSANCALAHHGFPEHEIDAYRYFVGDGVEMLAIRALPEECRDQATVGNVVASIDQEYAVRWANNTHPFPGIPGLLDDLTKSGTRLAILTNKGQNFAELTVSKSLSDWHFDVILGAQPAIPKKPDPTGALQIVSQMRLPPATFLYLGDSAVDMKTAVGAGMFPVGALWGFRTADELIAGGARALAKKPGDVMHLLSS